MTAVVTGASSGIGAATARRLADEGYNVLALARRKDRLEALGVGTPVVCDVTKDADVAAFAKTLSETKVDLLVNNAGGAHGSDYVEHASVDDWQWMFDVNVLGTLRMTRALLPLMSDAATIITMSSTAGLVVYEGGGGYTAAKHAQTALVETLRLELNGRPIRVVEIDPGMVKTDEFALIRFGGDADRAAAVYAGVEKPLTAEDIAECVAWCAGLPHHINIDRLVVRPLAQAAQHKVHRVAQPG